MCRDNLNLFKAILSLLPLNRRTIKGSAFQSGFLRLFYTITVRNRIFLAKVKGSISEMHSAFFIFP